MFLMACHAIAAPVVIDFSGFVDPFNKGPFTANTALFGQLVLDDTIVPTGPNNTFDNVVLSFSLTVQEAGGDVVFTSAGPGGRVQQFVNNSTEFVQIGFGSSSSGIINGIVQGSSGPLSMTNFGIDFRGVDLFGDPTVLATSLTEADFTFSQMTTNYDTIGLEGLMVDRTLDTVTFSGNESINEPPLALLTLLACLSIAALGRGRHQAPRN